MTPSGYAYLGLTALVALVVGALAFAVLRIGAGMRDTRRHLQSGSGAETAFLSAALQDAVGRLKAQEQEMRARAAASEALSDEIVASLTAGLLVADAEGRIRILNPAGRRLLGIDHDPVGVDVRVALAATPPLAAAVLESMNSGVAIVRRTLAMPPSSRTTHVGVTASPVGASAGRPAGVICLFSDLTEVHDLEEQLRLKETLARLGELTAGIAHEFRNGLATIHGYGRLIEPDLLPERYRPYMAGIRQETEALGQVVNNFLNFARPEQLALVRGDLGAVVRRAVDDIRVELPEGASLAVSGEFCDVECDAVLLRQALANLLRNGVEAATEAGRVPTLTVQGTLDRERDVCRLTVDDNGPGVAPDLREKVFRPFFTTRARGTGLGLAIVQKIVLTHNGKIALGESPAGGARFVLTFRSAPMTPDL